LILIAVLTETVYVYGMSKSSKLEASRRLQEAAYERLQARTVARQTVGEPAKPAPVLRPTAAAKQTRRDTAIPDNRLEVVEASKTRPCVRADGAPDNRDPIGVAEVDVVGREHSGRSVHAERMKAYMRAKRAKERIPRLEAELKRLRELVKG